MKMFALLVVAHAAAGAPITWPPAFSYDTVPTWAFPGRTSAPGGLLNASMVEYFSKFQLLDLSGLDLTCHNGTANPLSVTCPGGLKDWVGNQEQVLPQTAVTLRAHKPQSYVFPYVYFGCSQAWHESGQTFDNKPEWWVNATTTGATVTCNSFGYVYDFTQADVQQFFLDSVVSPLLTDDTAGVFFDEVMMVPFVRCPEHNCTADYIKAVTDSSLQVIRSTCKLATSRNKLAIMSFNTHRVPPTYYNQVRTILAEEGGMHYYEFFCAWQGLGCLSDVLDMMESVALGVPVQAHAPFSEGEDIQFKLGSFLLAMGNLSYFSWGKGNDWTLDAWPWVKEYDHNLGKPLGAAQNSSAHIWTREFEHASVWINFDKSLGNITWA